MYVFLYYLLLFFILVFQTSTKLFGGDSSEYAFTGATWSIPHPPGYPFYSFLSNILVRLIPLFTISWRISIISSASTVLTSYFIYKILKLHKLGTFVSLFSATFYVFLFPIWLYSLVPEVFALTNLLIATTTFVILRFRINKKITDLYLLSFLIGLQTTHHHLFVLLLPGWWYLLSKSNIVTIVRKTSKKERITSLFLFFIAFCFYLYAPIVSYFGAISDWENAKTLVGLMRLITRAAYGTFKASSGSMANIMNQLNDVFSFFVFLLHDLRITGILLTLLGFVLLKKTNSAFFRFIVMTFICILIFYFYTNFNLTKSLSIAMYERFLIPSYFILIFPFAYGIQYLLNIFKLIIKKFVKNGFIKQVVIKMFYVFIIIYFLIIAYQNYQTIADVRNLDVFETYAKNLLDTPTKNAILQIGTDNSYFPTAYYYYVNDYRKDTKLILLSLISKLHYQQLLKKLYPTLYIPDNLNPLTSSMVSFLNKNSLDGIYFQTPVATDSWRPYGLLWKYYRNIDEAKKDEENLLANNKRLWDKVYTIPDISNKSTKNILHVVDVQQEYLKAYINYSKLLFSTHHIQEAENVIRTIYTKYKKHDVVTQTILVNILVEQGNCNEAKNIAQKVPLNSINGSLELLGSYNNYYAICDKQNQNFAIINNLYNNLKKESDQLQQEF